MVSTAAAFSIVTSPRSRLRGMALLAKVDRSGSAKLKLCKEGLCRTEETMSVLEMLECLLVSATGGALHETLFAHRGIASRHMGKGLRSPAIGSFIFQNRNWC